MLAECSDEGVPIGVSSVCIGILVMAVAVIAGYKMRGITHAIFPVRDPVFLSLLMLKALALAIDCAGMLPMQAI